ncbi:Polyribonucleotide nucleotidyltransferase OS=Lysinibacillus sphaericus OX=1421 GN=pnp PE=3 SV=1 [Lysinibacillus sphaericus]
MSTIHLSVAGNKDAINMVEAGALEVPEEVLLEAIMFGHEEIKKVIAFQEQIVAEVGKEKLPVTLFEIDEAIQADIKAACETDMHDAIQTAEKHARDEAITAVKESYHCFL